MSNTSTQNWQEAIQLDDLWEGDMIGVELDGRQILLINVDGEVYAYRNRCPHQAWALDQGELEDGVLTCSRHLWEFDARTGRGVNPDNCALARYPCRVTDEGAVLVDLG